MMRLARNPSDFSKIVAHVFGAMRRPPDRKACLSWLLSLSLIGCEPANRGRTSTTFDGALLANSYFDGRLQIFDGRDGHMKSCHKSVDCGLLIQELIQCGDQFYCFARLRVPAREDEKSGVYRLDIAAGLCEQVVSAQSLGFNSGRLVSMKNRLYSLGMNCIWEIEPDGGLTQNFLGRVDHAAGIASDDSRVYWMTTDRKLVAWSPADAGQVPVNEDLAIVALDEEAGIGCAIRGNVVLMNRSGMQCVRFDFGDPMLTAGIGRLIEDKGGWIRAFVSHDGDYWAIQSPEMPPMVVLSRLSNGEQVILEGERASSFISISKNKALCSDPP